MSGIIDYKVLLADVVNIATSLQMFIESVNVHLKDGYTLHGNTLINNNRDDLWNFRISQAIVKYEQCDVNQEYTVLWAWGHRDPWGIKQSENMHTFEQKIKEMLIDGWNIEQGLQCIDCSGDKYMYVQALKKSYSANNEIHVDANLLDI
jgi:hypothetical protein